MTQPRQVAIYMSASQIAERLGLKSRRSLDHSQLPPHDAEVGGKRGWLPETVEAWIASRPGRGWHGPRAQ
ncbi:helix-turn-helix DNA binding domain protein [Mycobacterium phage Thonko]|uniref:Helix-turn-helix DNA binding domain protein n=1 Tax=Mycobacterium phage Thonko TaxID=2282910 RepID=A0A346FC90_9CAUD|nr:DNA binding protein [Mycobacterium phage Thonko]AXN53315.1 helix-turn-helix DNA binding domain protein [Mycobacterium phage Thonko]